MRKSIGFQILVNFTILFTLCVGLGVMDEMRGRERLVSQSAVKADIERDRAEIKANYEKAKEKMRGVEAKTFKAHGCTTKPTLTDFVLVRVAAPGDSFDPYRVKVVSFDDALDLAKSGAWISGYCVR